MRAPALAPPVTSACTPLSQGSLPAPCRSLSTVDLSHNTNACVPQKWVLTRWFPHTLFAHYILSHLAAQVRKTGEKEFASNTNARVLTCTRFTHKQVYLQLLAELKRMGSTIVYASPNSIIVATNKITPDDASAYIKFVLQSITYASPACPSRRFAC